MPDNITKTCQSCQNNFTIEPEDIDFYNKIDVPHPTFCPECRLIRRLVWRNDHYVYKRKCDFSGQEVFSTLSPESPLTVYDEKVWHSDSWDPMEYGRDYDFSRPFFEQLVELYHQVPVHARSVVNDVNSKYSANFDNFKNCYLCFGGSTSEDCYYSNTVSFSKECYDVLAVNNSELCYDSFWLIRCNKVFYSAICYDSYDIWFSVNLKNCSNCFGCVNLRNKQYYIFNKSYSKEEYNRIIQEYISSYKGIEEIRNKFNRFRLEFVYKFSQQEKNENVIGEYIFNSKDVFFSYLILNSENVKYSQFLRPGSNKDVYDITYFNSNEFCYENTNCGLRAYNLKFCYECYGSVKNLEYCINCQSNTSDCFACISLRNKQYCILNKQYTKEEYE